VEDIWPRLREIFRDVFDNQSLEINEKSTAQDVPGWDSLTNINLIFAVESEFKVKFALGEIQELANVGEMVALIEKKRAAKR
jgi:acyl carrier protein